MKRSEFNKLKTMKKTELVKVAADAIDNQEKLETELQVASVTVENSEMLRQKIEAIGKAVVERFDADGIDDIQLPTGKNILTLLWWAITNASKLLALIREIINILKTSE